MKINKLVLSYWQSVQTELLAWARFPMEKKFLVALAFLITSLLIGGITPIFSSTLNVWGMIIFFEALFQKKIKWDKWNSRDVLTTYALAGIIGTILASFLLLYFDVLYYLKLSTFDLLTRYVWFLIPFSKILPALKKQKRL